MDSTPTPFIHNSRNKSFTFSIIFTLFMLFFTATAALAQAWYVKPSAEIPLRRGQGNDYKIIAILQNGTQVSILEENAPWVKIVTPRGKEGWMLKRYLEQDQPLHFVVEKLRKENTSLKEKYTAIKTKNSEIAQQNKTLQSDLTSRISDLTKTQEQYQTLTQDTADVVLIKNNFDKSQETIQTLEQQLSLVSAENGKLKSSQNIKWFLAGGGTLIFGCIVGMMSAKSRKRKSSLY